MDLPDGLTRIEDVIGPMPKDTDVTAIMFSFSTEQWTRMKEWADANHATNDIVIQIGSRQRAFTFKQFEDLVYGKEVK